MAHVVPAALHIESAGVGAPLVLLHGWGLHAGFFAPALAALAAQGRVHAVDLPGHGLSAPLSPYTLDGIVDTLAAAFEHESRPLTVLGWSFGGTVAQRFAARYPERVARLVLVCTTPRFLAAPDWAFGVTEATARQFGDELVVAHGPTLKRFLALQMQGAEDPRNVLAAMRSLLGARPLPDRAALVGALDILVHTDLRAAVPSLLQPTLVVTGGHDTLTPAGAGAWLAQAMPAARLAHIPAAAHIPFLSHPDLFHDALHAFLNAHPA